MRSRDENYAPLCLQVPIVPTSPITAAMIPPINIHMALFVGEPVNVRETLELKEFDAFTPKMIKTIPAVSSAINMALYILLPI